MSMTMYRDEYIALVLLYSTILVTICMICNYIYNDKVE